MRWRQRLHLCYGESMTEHSMITAQSPVQERAPEIGELLEAIKAECLIPGRSHWDADTATELLTMWLDGLGYDLSSSPASSDQIIRWDEVRAGDLVLISDELTPAERVDICQKPWGDGTTFTAVDVYYRLDNGCLVSNEHRGDSYTAVRRYAETPGC